MNGSWLKNEMGMEMADTQQKRELEQSKGEKGRCEQLGVDCRMCGDVLYYNF